MDADRLPRTPSLPPPESVCVRVEPIVEPLSGMPLYRVSATWDAPADSPADLHFLEVRYDGQTASRWPVSAVRADDVPAGCVRMGAGLQLPCEGGVERIDVVFVGPDGEVVLDSFRDAAEIEARPFLMAPPAAMGPPGFVRRAARSLASGEAFSPRRWKARFERALENAAALERKVHDRLLARRFRPRPPHETYVENTAVGPRLRAAMLDDLSRFRYRPTISVLMPVYDVDPRWLRKAVESVRAQIYPNWQLCLADDASTRSHLLRYLRGLPADARIQLVRRPTNGHICAATNSAADRATGEFVALMDNDDELAPHALYAMAEVLQRHPDADLIYSDEDKIDVAGRRYDPQFKPDWSPELLLSYNYVNHFTCVRRSLFEGIGRFRLGYEGAQDHDLLLRLTECTDRIHRVPQVLYHWRAVPSSTAAGAAVKGYVHAASRRAVAEALARRGANASPYAPPVAERLGLPIRQLDGPDDGPQVAVLIHGPRDAAERTARAVRERTAYRDRAAAIVPEGDANAVGLNRAAANRPEEFLLFLEAGAEPTGDRWLSRLIAYASLEGVGAATGLIVSPDGRVVSAGPVLGMRDGVGPADAFAGLSAEAVSYYFHAETARDLGAVGRSCLLVRRDTFERLGGFDARRYPRALWAVDFGMRLRGLGLRCAYVPGAEFRLGTGARPDDPPTELLALKAGWGRAEDPFHNPNFSVRAPFAPSCDGPLTLPREAGRPAVRVLAVSHTLNAAEGAPRCLVEVVRGLGARGIVEASIWSPLGGSGESAARACGSSVNLEPGPLPQRFVDGLWTPREYRRFQAFARGLFARERPELVLANTLLSFPMVEAAAAAGVPAVWVLHESYSESQMAQLFPRYACGRIEAAFAMAARVVPVSHDAAARYARFDVRGNVRVIHNGLSAAPFDEYLRKTSQAVAARAVGVPPGKKLILAVGTVCERKGQHALVEAAAILARTRADFVCDLVGVRDAVPYARYVRELVRRRGLEGVVRLVPETGDVRPHYRAADALVNASHLEAYSLSILEAEAFGLPIVSTPCPGANEQVAWGENALPFAPSDAAALAAALNGLLDDPERRSEMGRQSRAMFEVHATDREMIDRYANLILSAARGGPRGRGRFECRAETEAAAPAVRRAA